MSYVVYWLNELTPQAKHFTAEELEASLKFTESLRVRALDGEEITFVTLASENINNVGKRGVDVTDASYDWKKRRI